MRREPANSPMTYAPLPLRFIGFREAQVSYAHLGHPVLPYCCGVLEGLDVEFGFAAGVEVFLCAVCFDFLCAFCELLFGAAAVSDDPAESTEAVSPWLTVRATLLWDEFCWATAIGTKLRDAAMAETRHMRFMEFSPD